MASITVTKKKQKQKIKEPQIKITWKEIKRQKVLLIWSAIIVVYGVIFCYLPLGGWLMAFQNYKPRMACFILLLWDLQNSSSYFPMQPFCG